MYKDHIGNTVQIVCVCNAMLAFSVVWDRIHSNAIQSSCFVICRLYAITKGRFPIIQISQIIPASGVLRNRVDVVSRE